MGTYVGAPPVFVEARRGGLAESLHRGHLVAMTSGGEHLVTLGDAGFQTYLRSAAKPLQAIPVLESGAARHFRLDDSELALMCGSVSGQDFHVAAVRSVLGKIGLGEEALCCGIHRPSHRPTAMRISAEGGAFLPVHNNCAGKHVAMLTLCVFYGWDPTGYVAREHPVQRLIQQVVAHMCGLREDQLGIGIDGCGVPVFRTPLSNLALAYARLAAPEKDGRIDAARCDAIVHLMSACRRHPEMVAGDERVCTEAMRAGKGEFFAKTGAEGSYGIALFDRGIGVAFKMEDGAQRAISPVVIEVLRQCDALPAEAVAALAAFHRPAIRNHRKEIVGELAPVLSLDGRLSVSEHP